MGSLSIWHWAIIIVVFGGLFFLIWAAVKRGRSNTKTPRGVGGWLVVPIFGFVAVIGLTIKNFYDAALLWNGIWAILVGSIPESGALRMPMILSELFGVGIIISASLCLYRIFFSKVGVRQITTIHYSLLFFAMLNEVWLDYMLSITFTDTPQDPSVIKDAVRAAVAAAVWVPYFWISKRVKNTFDLAPTLRAGSE